MTKSITAPPSRRAILAAGAVAATVFGAVTAAAHGAEASELLNLIAKHKAAREAFCDAIDIQEAAEGRFDDTLPDMMVPAGPGRYYDLAKGYDFCKEGIAHDFEEQRQRLKGLVHLDPAAGEQAMAAINAKEAERLAILDRNFASVQARKEACGLAAADRLWQETNDAERAAAVAMLAYKCLDIHEARVKAKYLLSSPLLHEIHEGEFLAAFLGSFVDGEHDALALL